MKDTKRRIEAFLFFDYTGIARHLTKMAEKGWLLEKISNFGWTYRRTAPKKLTFSVCYYPKASDFDPEPTEEQKEFHDFCKHTGWVLAATSAQMQIFYNEQENLIPIDTDPMLEIETIHAAAKKSYLPRYFVLLLVSILNGTLFVSRILGDFIGGFQTPRTCSQVLPGSCYFCCALLNYAVILFGMAKQKGSQSRGFL